jgi:methionyl-tRNA formyltransferase
MKYTMDKGEKKNFIFWGTPEVAAETLEILKSAGYMPALIITAPDRPQGRKLVITPPPVKVWAEENNVPYMQPEEISDEFMSRLNLDNYNLSIVVAYGKILPEKLIQMPPLGFINIHYSLLPRWRGASPVEAAILAGDTETGVTIQQMAFKMDAGPVLAIEKTPIDPDEKAEKLKARLTKLGGELLANTLPNIFDKTTIPTEQDESQATYCTKIKKEEGLVDPKNDDPVELYNKFRAYAKWPRIFYFEPNGKRVIITDAALEPARSASSTTNAGGDGKFVIKKIIPEGKKETTVG